jgi:hypothetical protein
MRRIELRVLSSTFQDLATTGHTLRNHTTVLDAFRDPCRALGSLKYEQVLKFQRFLKLPAEIRAAIIHEYLLLERKARRLSKNHHYDDWGSRCCVWEYPNAFIACDNQDPSAFPPPETARAPEGWLPALSFTSKRMLSKVTVHMLQRTARIDLKYIQENFDFEIATWFQKFLAAIHGGDGVTAVNCLRFPLMHKFNSLRIPPAPTSPTVELMAACLNLRKVGFNSHAEKLLKTHSNQAGVMVP